MSDGLLTANARPNPIRLSDSSRLRVVIVADANAQKADADALAEAAGGAARLALTSWRVPLCVRSAHARLRTPVNTFGGNSLRQGPLLLSFLSFSPSLASHPVPDRFSPPPPLSFDSSAPEC